MPLQNLKDAYGVGAVVFNHDPTLKLQAQILARQQAKRDALDQYYQKALTDVTPAGMRNKDVIGGWSQKLADWQSFAMNPENRKYLINPKLDNYKTVTEFNQRHQDLINDAQRSKKEAEEEKLINQHRLNGKWNPTEDDIRLLDRKAKSIYESGRLDEAGNEPDLTELSFNMPEFTPAEEIQLYKSATQGLQKSKSIDASKQRLDNTSGLIYTPFKKQYTIDQIKSIGNLAAANLTKRAKAKYDNIMHDPQLHRVANDAYQQVYGSDDFIDSPEKMAKGVMAIHALSDVETGEDKAVNYSLREQNAMKHIYANRGGIGGAGQSTGNAFDDIPDTEYTDSKVIDGMFYNKKDNTPKNGEVFLPGNLIPSSIKSALNAGGIDDKFLIEGVNATVKDGKIQSISNKKIGTVSRGAMENVYQPKMDTEPKGGRHLKFSNPKQKTYNYKGKVYTLAQIEAKAKQSGRTVDEYIKEVGLK